MDRNFALLLDLVGAERVFSLDHIVQILEISEHAHAAVEGWDGQGSRIVLTEGPDIFVSIKPFELWKQLKNGPAAAPEPPPVDIVWDTNSGPKRMLHWLHERGFEYEAAAWLDASRLVLFNCTRHTADGQPAPMPMETWMSFADFSGDVREQLLAKADRGRLKRG